MTTVTVIESLSFLKAPVSKIFEQKQVLGALVRLVDLYVKLTSKVTSNLARFKPQINQHRVENWGLEGTINN